MSSIVVKDRYGNVKYNTNTDDYVFNNFKDNGPRSFDPDIFPIVKIDGIYYVNDGALWYWYSKNDSATLMLVTDSYRNGEKSSLITIPHWLHTMRTSTYKDFEKYNVGQSMVKLRDYLVGGKSLTGVSDRKLSKETPTPYCSTNQEYGINKTSEKGNRYYWGFTKKYFVTVCDNFSNKGAGFKGDYFKTTEFSTLKVTVNNNKVIVDNSMHDDLIEYELSDFPYLRIALETPGECDGGGYNLYRSGNHEIKAKASNVYIVANNPFDTALVRIVANRDALWSDTLTFTHTRLTYYTIVLSNQTSLEITATHVTVNGKKYTWKLFKSAMWKQWFEKTDKDTVIEETCLIDNDFQITLPAVKGNLGSTEGKLSNGRSSYKHTTKDSFTYSLITDSLIIDDLDLRYGWQATVKGTKYAIDSVKTNVEDYSVNLSTKYYQHTYGYAERKLKNYKVKCGTETYNIGDNDSSFAIADTVCLIPTQEASHYPIPSFLSWVWGDEMSFHADKKMSLINDDGDTVSEINEEVFSDIEDYKSVDASDAIYWYREDNNFVGIRMGYAVPEQQPGVAVFLSNYIED